MANLNEAFELQQFKTHNISIIEQNNTEKPNKKSLISKIWRFIKKTLSCFKKNKLSHSAQEYLDNFNLINPEEIPPNILIELKKYSEKNNLNLAFNKEDAEKKFNEFNKMRNKEILECFKTHQLQPYYNKSTNKLSEFLSEDARNFLLNDMGAKPIPPHILNELIEFKKKVICK